MIESIAFFVYPVSDMTRARRFYEDALGLLVESNVNDEWIEYGLGGSTFAITKMDSNHPAGAKGGVIAFEVNDLDATVHDLKNKKVLFITEMSASPVCRFAVVSDPDGNEIIIHRRNEASL